MIMEPSVYSEKLKQAIEYVNKRVLKAPEVALILGSGLGALADAVKNPVVLRTCSIPNYPLSTVPGHEGRLVVGDLAGVDVVVVQGRVHMYEGYAPDDVVFPVRLVHAIGARNLIVTNAAGGISAGLKPGSLMWITDHIDWTWGRRPDVRRGSAEAKRPDNKPQEGHPRDNKRRGSQIEFTEPGNETRSRIRERAFYYDTNWMAKASETAREAGIDTSEGTYFWTRGPSYETPAEIRAFKRLGADVVGMSTVPEVLEACRLGMSVAGLSTVTNYAAGISHEGLDHSEVLEVGKRVRSDLEKLVFILLQFAP